VVFSMSKKDDEIAALANEKETLKARINNLDEENRQLRLRAKGLDQKLRKLKSETDSIITSKSKEVDALKEKIILVGKQAEKMIESKNREVEKLGTLVKERSFAIKSSQPFDLPSHSVIHGAILSEDSISIGDNVMVDGHLDSGGSVLIGAQTTVKGVVRATGDVTVRDESEVKGDVESGGSVFLGAKTKVGSIRSEGSVDIGEHSHVSRVMVRGDVVLGDRARVDGGIQYGGSMSIGKQTTVKGTIEFYEIEEMDDDLFQDDRKEVEKTGEDKEAREVAEKPKPSPIPSKSPQKPPRGGDARRGLSCPICGTPVPQGSKKCPGCGSFIKERHDAPASPNEEDIDIPQTVGKRKIPRRK